MKHNCQFKDPEDDEIYTPFLDAILNGYIAYDDFYDAYVIVICNEGKGRRRLKRLCGMIDILEHCPYCGDKLPSNNTWIRTDKNNEPA